MQEAKEVRTGSHDYLTADYMQSRKREFSLSAKSLPEEMKMIFDAFSAAESVNDLVMALIRLSMLFCASCPVAATYLSILHPSSKLPMKRVIYSADFVASRKGMVHDQRLEREPQCLRP